MITKQIVKAQIKERKENEGKAKKEDQAVEQAVANAADGSSGSQWLTHQAKQMADDFAQPHSCSRDSA